MDGLCKECGSTFTLSRSQASKAAEGANLFCSRACFHLHHRRLMTRKPTIDKTCSACGKLFELSKVQRWKMESGKAQEFFCGRKCATAWRNSRPGAQDWQKSPEIRKKRSEALKEHNWLQTPEARQRKMEVLKDIGPPNPAGPPVRGGNGRGPSVPQVMLAEALGWKMEFVVPTNEPRGSGYPSHYKIDIANPVAKIAIEVDGNSHASAARRAQDEKKDGFLVSRGWSVLRFSNREVMGNLSDCVRRVMSTTSR